MVEIGVVVNVLGYYYVEGGFLWLTLLDHAQFGRFVDNDTMIYDPIYDLERLDEPLGSLS